MRNGLEPFPTEFVKTNLDRLNNMDKQENKIELPKRKQLRIKDYDYSQNGYYFVTVCTYGRKRVFGKIQNGEMRLNRFGDIINAVWMDLVNHNNIKMHEYIIMPDHIHGIIEMCGRERSVTVPENNCYHFGIPEIIRQFKTFSSKRINEYLKRNGLEPFPTGKLWQKSYYDHIIRNEQDYITRVEYMINNPIKWEFENNVTG